MDIKLSLTAEETNYVLAVLSKEPFKEVSPVLNKIYSQSIAKVDIKPEEVEKKNN